MTVAELHPYVRYARRQDRFPIHAPIVACDRRIFYCLEGSITVCIDGRDYPVKKDTLLYWNAGLPYRYAENRGAVLLGFNFDMVRGSEREMAVPPEPAESFRVGMMTETTVFSDIRPFNGVVCLDGAPALRARFFEIEEEYAGRKILWQERCGALLADLLLQLARELLLPVQKNGNKATEVLAYIQKNYRLPLSNQRLGEIFRYHPNYINRLIVRQTGVSLHGYLIHCRIQAAIRLLETTELPVGTIAEEVGFGELSHFSKCFRRHTGQSPSAFRVR